MSKSVDETVVDFFRLLLAENTAAELSSKPPIKQVIAEVNSKLESDTIQSQREAISTRADIGLRQMRDFTGLKANEVLETYGLNDELQYRAKSQVKVKDEVGHNGQPSLATSVLINRPTPELRAEPSRLPPHAQFEAPLGFKSAEMLDKAALEKLLEPVFNVKNQLESKVNVKDEVTCVVAINPKQITTNLEQVVKNLDEPTGTPAVEVLQSTELETQTGVAPPSITKDLQIQLDDEFQVLFFKVAGLTLAVPLVSLGGIVKVSHINQIFGRPSWFLGVQTHRGAQLNLVNTCAWVMPEKYDETLAQSINYQYLVLLEDTNWGLACESLVDAVKIKQSEVNWRTSAGKRPWLAGVVKEQMCGILNVAALVRLLDAGLGCQDPIN